MPELPDITVYQDALAARVTGHALRGVRLRSPFLLRTFEPRPADAVGRKVLEIRRLGKRLVLVMEDYLFLVMHLMIAGRLQWKDKPGASLGGKLMLAAFDFDHGTLLFTEASKKQRASLHVLRGEAAVAEMDRGGLEPLTCTWEDFARVMREENHTVKRSLTDPTVMSGIGNAYSDEILHKARLSPFLQTQKMTDEQYEVLHAAMQASLVEWTERLRAELSGRWPAKVTAFRPEMAVHGKFDQPCPDCGTKVQRVAYADNEMNYCPTCQTEGRLLADRGLSKLLRGDWPKTLAELEERKRRLKEGT